MSHQRHGRGGPPRVPLIPHNREPGRNYTVPAPPAPQASGIVYTQGKDEFISRLPPKGFVPWERCVTIDPTALLASAIDNPPTGQVVVIDQVRPKTTRLIFWMSYFWLDAGLDPLDPDALTAFQDDQNIYGRLPFQLLANNAPVVDVEQVVFDPGIPGQRTISGYTRLNVNLLATGAHPTALYIHENQTLAAKFVHVDNPGHSPTAIGVELRGYSIPTSQFNKVMESIRT